jgi:HEAT repeat protein
MGPLAAFASRALIVVACGAPLLAQEVDGDARAREGVERCLADWRAGKLKSADQLCDSLVKLGRAASEPLCRLLDAPAPDVPVGPIARAVGRLGSLQSVPTLGRLAGSSVDEQRLAAVDALALCGREEALPFLVKALDDGELEVVEKAESALLATSLLPARVALALSAGIVTNKEKSRPARVIGLLGSDNAHELLLGHLHALEEGRRLAALQGLGILALSEDGPVVLMLLHDTSSVALRREACLFLGRVKCGAAVRDLIDLLRGEESGVSENAHWALQQITGLGLKREVDVWEFWWNRSGRKLYGLHSERKSDLPNR